MEMSLMNWLQEMKFYRFSRFALYVIRMPLLSAIIVMSLDIVTQNVRKKIGFNITRKFVMNLKKEIETDLIYNFKKDIYF